MTRTLALLCTTGAYFSEGAEHLSRQPFSAGNTSLFYVKVVKCASSTSAGVARRVAMHVGLNGSRAGQFVDEPGVFAHHGVYRRFTATVDARVHPTFVFSIVRDPAARCLSNYYEISGDTRLRITGVRDFDTSAKIRYANQTCSDFMYQYLAPRDGARFWELWRAFDFIGTVERYDESLVLLANRLRLPLTSITYLVVKNHTSTHQQTREQVDREPEAMNEQPMEVSTFFAGDAFRLANGKDYELWHYATQAVEAEIESYAPYVDLFRGLQAKAEAKCSVYDPKKVNCLWRDEQCNFKCLDRLASQENQKQLIPRLVAS